MKSFKEFISLKSQVIKEETNESKKEWKKEFIKLEKGFVPPSNLKSVVQAFADSNNISIMDDTSKEINMPKKSLYLSGGSVRDFLSNKTPKNYNLSTNATPKQIVIILKNAGFSEDNDNKTWESRGNNIIAIVNGDEFKIETFSKPGKNGPEFTDDMIEDAEKRDLTINSMYIELSKSDSENNKLYDPTKKGWYDITHGNIKSIGNAENKFREDKIRMMRAVRFYSQYGKGSIDKDVQKAISELKSDIKKLPKEEIKEEFVKGLVNPDIDPKKYLETYNKTGLLGEVFPNVELNLDIPSDFSNKKDKILALAWVLQNNSTDKVKEVLADWTHEKNAVVCLLKLKEFNVDNIDELLESKKISGLSEEQIRNWVELFNVEGRSPRPIWSKSVKRFARFRPDRNQLAGWNSDEVDNRLSPQIRSLLIKNLNKEKLKEMFRKELDK
jgi:tRNA nucleotidyltransferase/poly(A) polymerase